MTFRLASALLVAAAALAGCDSTRSNTALDELDGRYVVTQLAFDPVTASLPDADVAARLTPSATGLQVFGGDGSALLQSQFATSGGSRRTDLEATATRGRVTFTAVTADDERELADLFLPRQFTLSYDPAAPRTLTGEIQRTGVNLEAFDAAIYQQQRSNSGTLRIRLERAAN